MGNHDVPCEHCGEDKRAGLCDGRRCLRNKKVPFHDDPKNPQTCEVFEEWYHDPCPCKAEKPAEKARVKPPKGAFFVSTFHLVILQEMTRQGLNKAQLAAKMGISSQQLYRVFRPGAGMTLGTMERMAAALGVELKFQLVPRQLPLPLSDGTKDVHTEHCCLECGCKYNDPNCTVMLRSRPQSFPCSELADPFLCVSAYDISNGGLSRCPPTCPHCHGQPS